MISKKFRGWHEKLNRMVYGLKVCDGGAEWTDETGKDWYFDSDGIMQYTGLKNNKGIEIWEGDVLEFTYQYGFVDIHTPNSLQSETVIGEVYFENGQYLVEGFSLQKAINEFAENIGNKFDKPELLESEVEDG